MVERTQLGMRTSGFEFCLLNQLLNFFGLKVSTVLDEMVETDDPNNPF